MFCLVGFGFVYYFSYSSSFIYIYVLFFVNGQQPAYTVPTELYENAYDAFTLTLT